MKSNVAQSQIRKINKSNIRHCVFIVVILQITEKARGSEFSSYRIELRNRVTQNNVTLRVTNSNIFLEILSLSH